MRQVTRTCNCRDQREVGSRSRAAAPGSSPWSGCTGRPGGCPSRRAAVWGGPMWRMLCHWLAMQKPCSRSAAPVDLSNLEKARAVDPYPPQRFDHVPCSEKSRGAAVSKQDLTWCDMVNAPTDRQQREEILTDKAVQIQFACPADVQQILSPIHSIQV